MQLAGSAQLDVFLGVKNREAVIKDGISVNFPEILERKKKPPINHIFESSYKMYYYRNMLDRQVWLTIPLWPLMENPASAVSPGKAK